MTRSEHPPKGRTSRAEKLTAVVDAAQDVIDWRELNGKTCEDADDPDPCQCPFCTLRAALKLLKPYKAPRQPFPQPAARVGHGLDETPTVEVRMKLGTHPLGVYLMNAKDYSRLDVGDVCRVRENTNGSKFFNVLVTKDAGTFLAGDLV